MHSSLRFRKGSCGLHTRRSRGERNWQDARTRQQDRVPDLDLHGDQPAVLVAGARPHSDDVALVDLRLELVGDDDATGGGVCRNSTAAHTTQLDLVSQAADRVKQPVKDLAGKGGLAEQGRGWDGVGAACVRV
jgi:hypothetical protein